MSSKHDQDLSSRDLPVTIGRKIHVGQNTGLPCLVSLVVCNKVPVRHGIGNIIKYAIDSGGGILVGEE